MREVVEGLRGNTTSGRSFVWVDLEGRDTNVAYGQKLYQAFMVQPVMRPIVLFSSLATALLPMSFVVASHKVHSTKSAVTPALLEPTQLPESIPQMTNSTDCEFQNPWTWVCRDGYTLTGSDHGKLYLYRLGPTDHHGNIRYAVIRR